jgi:hypothetical protein
VEQGILKDVLVTVAQSGYVHYDVKWCHFRRWRHKDLDESRVVLIDLGGESLRKHNNTAEDVAAWIDVSLLNLRAKAGNTEVSTSSIASSPLLQSKRPKTS